MILRSTLLKQIKRTPKIKKGTKVTISFGDKLLACGEIKSHTVKIGDDGNIVESYSFKESASGPTVSM